MIVTSNTDFAKKVKMLRGHGQDMERYHHVLVGTNSRLDEIQAAVLRIKLKYLNQWNDKRSHHAAYYNQQLRNLPIDLPEIEPCNVSNFHQYVIKTKKRDQLKHYLADQGIGTAIYYPVILPLQPCFSALGHNKGDFPNAETCAATSLALPVHAELSDEQLEFVVDRIARFFQ
jgi:dTDP-4-amino-4,6-dideoxygalactose transaminase